MIFNVRFQGSLSVLDVITCVRTRLVVGREMRSACHGCLELSREWISLFVDVSVTRPHELPAPFDGQRQYSHQINAAPTLTDSSGRALTPGSGKFNSFPVRWTLT